MVKARSWFRRSATGVVALGVIASGPPAAADTQPDDPTSADEDTSVASELISDVTDVLDNQLTAALVTELGESRTSGRYLDDNGRMVVTVTDAAAERRVRETGAIPQLVTFSTEQLKTVTDTLSTSVNAPSTGWGIDVDTNQVVVDIGASVSEAKLAEIQAIVEPYGDAARINRLTGDIEPMLNGGTGIGAAPGCSLGFNVRKRSDHDATYFLTAGHCTNNTKKWYTPDGRYIGYRAGWSYGANDRDDFGIVRYVNDTLTTPGTVSINKDPGFRDITRAAHPTEGQKSVCRTGRMSRDCGMVLQKDWSGTYTDGTTVHGMFVTDTCAKPGDSGGAVHQENIALGLHSASIKGLCQSYHQPIKEALDAFGVEVY